MLELNTVGYAVDLDSPVGRMRLMASATGLRSLTLGDDGRKTRADRHVLLEAGARALRRYFDGEPLPDDLPLDLEHLTAFRRTVSLTLRAGVPAGTVITYGELAVMVKRPRAARAVGRVLATNPLPVFIPCHRVVGGSGPGGFGPGLRCKQQLLGFEGVKLRL
jgi:methylated-DNA-[protein]-cysteine S-methyltransferase